MLKIYSLKTCPYCINLIEGLSKFGISHNVVDIEINEEEFNMVYELTNSDLLPTVLLDGEFMVPEKDFHTISECLDKIKNHYNI